jgi:hypothetical protein
MREAIDPGARAPGFRFGGLSRDVRVWLRGARLRRKTANPTLQGVHFDQRAFAALLCAQLAALQGFIERRAARLRDFACLANGIDNGSHLDFPNAPHRVRQ